METCRYYLPTSQSPVPALPQHLHWTCTYCSQPLYVPLKYWASLPLMPAAVTSQIYNSTLWPKRTRLHQWYLTVLWPPCAHICLAVTSSARTQYYLSSQPVQLQVNIQSRSFYVEKIIIACFMPCAVWIPPINFFILNWTTFCFSRELLSIMQVNPPPFCLAKS